MLKKTNLLAFVAVIASAPMASATTTFGQFFQQSATQAFTWTNNGSGTSTLTGSTAVDFNYSNIVGLPAWLQGPQSATLTINASTTGTATAFGPFASQAGIAGVISIIRAGGGNLLTVSFSNGNLFGEVGGGSASMSVSTPPLTQVVYTSDFLDFSAVNTQRAFGLSFSSVTPSLAIGAANQLRTFSAAGTGTFSSEPVPDVATPEPASMGLLGGGLLGLVAFGRRFAKK